MKSGLLLQMKLEEEFFGFW